MTAGRALRADELSHQRSRSTLTGLGAQRQVETLAVAAAAQDEVRSFPGQQQVRHFGHQIGVGDAAHVDSHQIAQHLRRAERAVQRRKMRARHLGLGNPREQVKVHQRKKEQIGHAFGVSGLAAKIARLGPQGVEQCRGQRRVDGHVQGA